MAETVSEPALNSFTIEHASGLHSVARKLDELHHRSIRSLAVEGTGATGAPVLNLVAVCTAVDDADLASQTVGVLSQTHPTRAIVIFADPDSPAGIEADISLQRGNGRDEDVTAEQVRLNVHGPAAYHLASVVLPLLVPDIPVYLWLAGSPPPQQAFGDDAVAISERIVIDTGAYHDAQNILSTLSHELGEARTIGVTDIAWHRNRIWREMLAQAFDGPEMRPFVQRITRAEVRCSGVRPSTQGWLFGGWLAERLNWAAPHGPYLDVTAELSDVPSNDLTRVQITCIGREHNAMVKLERTDDCLTTSVEIDGGIAASQTFALRDPDMAHLVASLLEEGANDPTYMAALHRAAGLTSGRQR